MVHFNQIFHLDKAIKKENLFEVNCTYGVFYLNINDYENATFYLDKAMNLAKETKDDRGIARVLYRLANLSQLMKEYDKAEEKLKESLTKLEKSNANKILIAHNLFLLGNNLYNRKNNTDAINYYNKAVRLYKQCNSFNSVGYCLSSIGGIYIKNKKFDLAEKYLDSAIDIQSKYGDRKYLANTYNRKTILFFNKKDYKSAINSVEKFLEISKKLKRYREVYIGYHNLGFLYDTIGQSKKGYKHMLTAFRYKDTVMKNDYHEKLATIETKYQTQQKENEILKLTNDNIQKEASLTQSKYTIFAILGALLLIVGFGYFYWNKRKQQYKLALLENSIKSSETEKSRIGKELHDNIAGALMKLVHDSETAHVQLSHKLLQTYNDVRDLSHQLDNTSMHGGLFFERVMDIVPENTEKQTFDFKISPHYLEIKEPYGTHIYRVIQELITNNLKYAKATETTINLVLEKDNLKLEYADNGVGTSTFKKGNGYKNIDDRITLMNGSLEIEHQSGFSVSAKIPYTV